MMMMLMMMVMMVMMMMMLVMLMMMQNWLLACVEEALTVASWDGSSLGSCNQGAVLPIHACSFSFLLTVLLTPSFCLSVEVLRGDAG